MSGLRHNLVHECPACKSHHVTDHCKFCDWWLCRRCGTYGKPGGPMYHPKGKAA